MGVALFNAPARIVDGGSSGIATILHATIGWNLGLTNLAITIPLFLLGYFCFGRGYGIRSLSATILLSVFITMIDHFCGSDGVLDLNKDTNYLLSSLSGGVLSGLGIGMVLKAGATSGGTDVFAQLLAKHTPLTQGQALFFVDGLVILTSAFCFGLEIALYGILTCFIDSLVIDRVNIGFTAGKEKSVMIISDKPEGIEQAILHDLGHGGTILTAHGMYTKGSKPVIMTVVPKTELRNIKKLVQEEDEHAFVIVQNAYEVLGGEFTPIEEATWSAEHDLTQD